MWTEKARLVFGKGDTMGIRFFCPNGHRLNVKSFQAGMRGICPHCGISVEIPAESTRPSSKEERQAKRRERVEQASRDQAVPEVRKKQPPERPAAPAGEASAAGVPALPTARPAGSPPSPTARPATPLEEFPLFGSTETAVPATSGPAAQAAPAATTASATASTGIPAPPRADSALGMNDPLDEAPSAVWYVRPTAGGQYGPAGREIMRVWIAEGRVGPDSLVWREGWRDWQEAGQVFPQLAPADDAVPGLRSIIEEEVFAVGPVVSSPGGAARRASEQRDNSMIVILVAALALVAIVVAVLWIWLGSGSDSGRARKERPTAQGVAQLSDRRAAVRDDQEPEAG